MTFFVSLSIVYPFWLPRQRSSEIENKVEASSTFLINRETHHCSFNERNFFFTSWFFSRTSAIQDSRWEAISLTPLYHLHPLRRHLDICRAITVESSPLHIATSRTRTGNLWFPSAIQVIKFLIKFTKSWRLEIDESLWLWVKLVRVSLVMEICLYITEPGSVFKLLQHIISIIKTVVKQVKK